MAPRELLLEVLKQQGRDLSPDRLHGPLAASGISRHHFQHLGELLLLCLRIKLEITSAGDPLQMLKLTRGVGKDRRPRGVGLRANYCGAGILGE